MVSTSSIISIIYFSTNIILLLLLGYYVKKKGKYDSIKSKAFIKDIWNQRTIYAPLIVHFYDTATDIGVIYYWYGLMVDQRDGIKHYQSLNMTVFFWCGITFLLVYRVATFLMVIFLIIVKDHTTHPLDLVLVLLDVYIFKAVYESFKVANSKMVSNARKRKANQARRSEQHQEKGEMELQIRTNNTNNDKDDEENIEEENHIEEEDHIEEKDHIEEEKPIEMTGKQLVIQFLEAITESMPQIMLQCIFVIRSKNDPDLADNDNILLISLSVFASMISIANKFVSMTSVFSEDAAGLGPRMEFPKCINYWYIVRVIWRICDVISKFAVYVLIWTVMGGAWLGILFVCMCCWWTIYFCIIDKAGCVPRTGSAVYLALVSAAGVLFEQDHFYAPIVIKFVESCIGLTIVAVFATMDFECGICSPSEQRLFDNASDNVRILRFFIMGCVSALMDVILFSVLYCFRMMD